MKKIEIRTGAWCGDKLVQLEVPDNWEVRVKSGNPPQAMSEEQMEKAISGLAPLTTGKKNAVIIIDDIMRPTPTADLLPIIVKILNENGINNTDITIVIASGSHARTKEEDMIKKVGEVLCKKIRVIPHDDTALDLIYLQKTKLGTPMYVNKLVMEAQLKISIGGLYPHPEAGWSGGAKIIAPGVCGVETIRYMHGALIPANKQGEIKNGLREESVRIARKVGLDFSINVILTPDRKIGDLCCGDVVEAHALGAARAEKYYRVESEKRVDVVISNAYPFDGSYYFFSRGFWPLYDIENGLARVLIVNGSMTRENYFFKPLPQTWREYLDHVVARVGYMALSFFDLAVMKKKILKHMFLRKPVFVMYYTGDVNRSELERQFPKAKITGDWSEVLKILRSTLKEKEARVAVYPVAGLMLSSRPV